MSTPHTELRHLLRRGGYSPIPLEGKRPALKAWEQMIAPTFEQIEYWEKLFNLAANTGILTRLTPALDIDIMDPAAAQAVEEIAREWFEEPRGDAFRVRFGESPKRAILLRTDVPFPKQVRNVVAPNGAEYKIELLCDGQQIVVDGIHPKTGQPYIWHGGDPTTTPLDELPYVDKDIVNRFLNAAVEMLVEQFDYRAASERPTAGNGQDGAHQPADWAWLIENIKAGRELHDSTVAVAAKLVARGIDGDTAITLLRSMYDTSLAKEARRQEWQDRRDDIPRAVASAGRKYAPQTDGNGQDTREPPTDAPLPYVDLALDPIPPRDWFVADRIPAHNVTLLSGEGAKGKSLLLMMLSGAAVLPGKYWLGIAPKQGPVFYVSCEEDDKEICRRMEDVAAHYGFSRKDLIERGLHGPGLATKHSQ
jgi:AAA domain/Bifunctional DNA primase/polymerase, N-terminal